MTYQLAFEGHVIGTIEFGPPEEKRGLRLGALMPTEAYRAARPAFRAAVASYAAGDGAAPEVIRERIIAATKSLFNRGLALRRPDGRPVMASFLQVFDFLPPDFDLTLTALMPLVQVGAVFSDPDDESLTSPST